MDNSDWSRNGDYVPTRYLAQLDAIKMLFNSKMQENAENAVGIVSAAGGAQVQVTLTGNMGKILQALHQVKIGGESEWATAVQIAQLALKHRQNKVQKQRIMIFVASPVDAEEKELERLAKRLKKNNVAVDVVSLGEWEANEQKLQKLVQNAGEGSRYERVIKGESVSSSVGKMGELNAMDQDMGEMDDELALAIQLSLQEEEARVNEMRVTSVH